MRIHLAETSQTGGAVGFGKESPSDHVNMSGSTCFHPVLRPEAEAPRLRQSNELKTTG
jgi:hypothetical protein